MKTILSTLAFVALIAAAGYTQDKCGCKKKVVHRANYKHTLAKTNLTKKDNGGCYSWTKHNIKVTECPNDFAATGDDNSFMLERSYLGYYPSENNSRTNNTDNDASLNTTILRNPDLTPPVAPSTSFTVSSPAFDNYGVMPSKYTCEGSKASPPLSVSNIPADTKSLAVIMYDPEATKTGSMTYWLMWNIDPSQNIPENFVSDNEALNAAKEWGYQAVCPVSGNHNYHFVVYALDTKLLLNRYTDKAGFEKAAKGHVLARGELVGQYNRQLD